MTSYTFGAVNRWGESLTSDATVDLLTLVGKYRSRICDLRKALIDHEEMARINHNILQFAFDTGPSILEIDGMTGTKNRRDAFRVLTDYAVELAHFVHPGKKTTWPVTQEAGRSVSTLRNLLTQEVLRLAATGMMRMARVAALLSSETAADMNRKTASESQFIQDMLVDLATIQAKHALRFEADAKTNMAVTFENHDAKSAEEQSLTAPVRACFLPHSTVSPATAPKEDGAESAKTASETHTTHKGTTDMTDLVSNAAVSKAIENNAFANIDPVIANIIDHTLAGVGLPKVSDLAQGLKELAEKAKRGGDGMKLAIGEAMGYKPSGPTTIPAGKCVTRKASDVFGLTGAAATPFNFEVPTYEWDAPHPHVPAIDTAYQFQPQQLMAILIAIVTDQRTWLYGDTGCGKTTVIEQIAARLNYPVIRVNFDSEITRMDLIGAKDIVVSPSGTSVTTFTEGVLPTAMQMPCIFLADELDFIRADVAYVFQRVLEGNGLSLPEDSGRIVRPHPGFRIVATGNTRGDGDDTGRYQGAKPQSAAFLDRFTTWVQCDYMSDKQVKEMLVKKFPGLATKAVDTLTAYAKEHWTAFKGGQVLTALSPRGLLSCAMTYTVYASVIDDKKALVNAMKSTFVDRASREDAQTIQGLISRVIS